MNPIISIIVPVYNAEKTLNRCIDSILNQTFQDWELLLIDDGSTDRSGKLCDQYAAKDHRIKVFHKENGGVSSARNVGLDHTKGKWITFIDSDDYIYDNIFALIPSHNEDILIFNYDINNNGTTRCGEGIPPQPVRERPFWGVSHRVEPLSRLHLSPSKGIYFFILKFCFMLNNSS